MRRRLTLKPWISRMQSELQEPESSGRTRVMTKVAFKQRPQDLRYLTFSRQWMRHKAEKPRSGKGSYRIQRAI